MKRLALKLRAYSGIALEVSEAKVFEDFLYFIAIFLPKPLMKAVFGVDPDAAGFGQPQRVIRQKPDFPDAAVFEKSPYRLEILIVVGDARNKRNSGHHLDFTAAKKRFEIFQYPVVIDAAVFFVLGSVLKFRTVW